MNKFEQTGRRIPTGPEKSRPSAENHIPPTMRIAMGGIAKVDPCLVDALITQLRDALHEFESGTFSEEAFRDLKLSIKVAEVVEMRGVVSGLSAVIGDASRALIAIQSTHFLDDDDQSSLEFFIQAHELQLSELSTKEFLDVMRSSVRLVDAPANPMGGRA